MKGFLERRVAPYDVCIDFGVVIGDELVPISRVDLRPEFVNPFSSGQ